MPEENLTGVPGRCDLDEVSAWQYHLPRELIAARPTERRDDARLMVLRRQDHSISHRTIRDLPNLLQAGDRLVLNDTRVLPARLFGTRTRTGGRWEGLFLDQPAEARWRIAGQTRGRPAEGESITLHPPEATKPNLQLYLERQLADGTWIVRPESRRPVIELLEKFGTLPLPPYIGRLAADRQDQDRYQTIFGSRLGAIAAPTAGLHFTSELFADLEQRGISTTTVTLHVGIGTFRPVTAARLSDHHMHAEWCKLSQTAVAEIESSRSDGGRITAIGTTSVRTLESAAAGGQLRPSQGNTDLFIRPGFEFRIVDQLLTNFHLPGSTLLVLAAALAGYDLLREAYQTAVAERYRFYSYGDAMLIL